NRDIKIFEIGKIFIPCSEGTEEKEMISGLISGLRYGETWSVDKGAVDFYDIKGTVEQVLTGLGIEKYVFISAADIPYLHPGKAGIVEINGKPVGITGEVHPDIMQRLDIKQPAYVFELDMSAIKNALGSQKKYTQVPRYPTIVRDAAMILNKDIQFQELYNAVKGLDIKLLEEVNVFDVYYGENIPEGKISIALRFMYRSNERTLTDDEINTAHSAILENLKHKFGIEIRGESRLNT
ncbi:MAG: hypothetical protein HZB81_04100, partial [Deltaproteobacteria bacterium]|nr:hypothetical protein [Deltaproteobacteria bacterium]